MEYRFRDYVRLGVAMAIIDSILTIIFEQKFRLNILWRFNLTWLIYPVGFLYYLDYLDIKDKNKEDVNKKAKHSLVEKTFFIISTIFMGLIGVMFVYLLHSHFNPNDLFLGLKDIIKDIIGLWACFHVAKWYRKRLLKKSDKVDI